MSHGNKENKEEVYWKILQAALELDFKKGHQKWTISDLSRTTGITRSLVYYYFGRSRGSILEEAVRLVGQEFFGLSPERLKLWQEGKMHQSAQLSKETAEKYPFLISFYFNHRFRQSDIGKAIRSLEKSHYQKVSKFLKAMPSEQFEKYIASLFGIVLCPHISSASTLFDN